MSVGNGVVIKNLLWRFAERVGAQGVSFVVSIILARLLAPEAYGTIALITVITNIFGVFVDSGMGNALIQKKDADELDFSTVFYFNIFMCCILYLVLFVVAPSIALFYNDITLTPVIRVLSVTILISGVKNIQHAYVSCKMQFRKFFFATLGGTVGAAIIGIALAYAGFGVWALVIQQLFNIFVDTIILWLTVKWRPTKQFSFQRLKLLYSFGSKLLAAALLDTIYGNARQLLIGKFYSTSDLAYYNRGNNFPMLIVTNINSSIDSVLLPTLSKEQDDKSRIKSMTRRAIKTSTFVMAPMMIGLIVCAKPFICLLLTEKWLPCVPYLRIFCITYLFYPIHTANLNAIKALGRSDIFLKMEIAKKIVGITLIALTAWHSVMAMAYSLLVGCVVGMVINSWPNKKLLEYGYFEQIKDIIPELSIAVVMGVIVSFLQMLSISSTTVLVLQIILGAIIYIGISIAVKLETFTYLWKMLLQYLKK